MEEIKSQYGCTTSTFPLFSKLPPELRHKIWRNALDREVETALYPYKPFNGIGDFWNPRWLSESEENFNHENNEENFIVEFRHKKFGETPLKLSVAFVNVEARSTAITWARAYGPGIRVCTGNDGHQPIFLHAFHPDRDALYVPLNMLEFLFFELNNILSLPDVLEQPKVSILHTIQRIAVSECMVKEEHDRFHRLFRDYSSMRLIYIVVGTSPHVRQQTEGEETPRFWKCEMLHRVAVWTGLVWEYNLSDVRYDETFCKGVRAVSHTLKNSLLGMGVQHFEMCTALVPEGFDGENNP